MINWFSRQSIRFNLLVMCLVLSIIPLMISITQNYYIKKANSIEMASVRLDGVALGHSKLVNQWFKNKLDLVKSFSNDPTFKTDDYQQIKELLLYVNQSNPEFRVFNYSNIDGNTIAVTSGNTAINVSERDYFKTALSGKPVISEILISKFYNDPCIAFAAPVKRDGKIIGVLAGSVALNELEKILDVSYEGKTFKSYLAGDYGTYIVPPNSDNVVKTNKLIPVEKEFFSLIKNNSSKGVYHLGENKDKKIVAFRKIPEARATLVVQQDESEAIEIVKGQGLKNDVYLTLILILLVVPFTFWVAKKLSRPLELMSDSLRQIAKGDFGQRIILPSANREVRVIAEEINRLGEQLQAFQATIEQQLIEMDEQKWEIITRNQELLDSEKTIKEQMEELHKHKLALQDQNNDLLNAQKQLTDNNRILEEMANTDQLTGSYNRRFFTAKLYQEIVTSLQNGQDLCVALLDLDFFKQINDTYGHKVGDQVLQQLTALIKKTIRDTDIIARFGGEEFIVLAPNTRIDGGQVIAEKIRSAVDHYQFETDVGIIRVTASIGVAFLSECEDIESVEQIEDCLFKIADHNLYTAKDLGRNRVVV